MAKRYLPQLLLSFLLLASARISNLAFAQVYRDYGKNRFTFAQTFIGGDLAFTPSHGQSFRFRNGDLEKVDFGNMVSPFISVSGLHFWGRAEFFTCFSLRSISLDNDKSFFFLRSPGTGFKYFVIPVRHNVVSPYIGMSIGSFTYRIDNAAKFTRLEFPLLAGVAYSFKYGFIELGSTYYIKNDYRYFISESITVPLRTPRLGFILSYKYFVDLSLSNFKKNKSPNATGFDGDEGKTGRSNSIFFAIGPAYSFFTSHSSYNKATRPYLDDYRIVGLFPDLGIGYYHYKMDAAVNLSFRWYTASLEGFGVRQKLKRRSIALETYKFLGDYHGFAPFLGPVLSYEEITLHEKEQGNTVFNHSNTLWQPGIIAGWDIRPKRSDWWGVRTNIRYFPFLKLKSPSPYSFSLQQIEVNFLQWVVYPGRLVF
ncbi:MAG TPA: hypothetical protein PLV21_06675 [Cyclobacteriaceae bacterium]|nr:hypothetical protein [Cyclobacteriaceae bacterium]HRJ81547.1 hypothetical protein [Cyclobacteriaceae bacterium]